MRSGSQLLCIACGGMQHLRCLAMHQSPRARVSEVLCCVQIYLLLLFLRVLLSWFPAFNWERQPWLGLRQVHSPLNLPSFLLTGAAA